jgi:membrane associated rhomboid family serine protease
MGLSKQDKTHASSVAEVLQNIVQSDDEEPSFHPSDSSSSSTSSSSYPSSDDPLPGPTYHEFHSDDDDEKFPYLDDEDYTDYSESARELERVEFFLSCFNLVAGRQGGGDDEDNHDDSALQRTRQGSEGHPKSYASAMATSCLLDDPDVLQAIRQSLRAPGGLAKDLDPALALYIKLFEFAQTQRDKKGRVRPYGILGLFTNLSDIRGDLMWAQDAAYRRETGQPYVAWADYYEKEQNLLVFPWFSSLILVASILMMIWAFAENDWVLEPMTINPLLGVSPETLLECGGLQGRHMIETKQWWRLLSPIVLHAGLIHLIMNCACIAYLGIAIERNHGHRRAAALFIVSAVGGNMFSALLQPANILVGASGGLFGYMGMCVADIMLNWRLLFLIFEQRRFKEETDLTEVMDGDEDDNEAQSERKCFACPANYNFCMRFLCGFWLCVDLIMNSLIGFTPYVDNYAHLGGLTYGFLLSLSALKTMSLDIFDQERQSSRLGWCCHTFRIKTLRSLGLSMAVLLFVTSCALVGISDGQHSPCLSCRYISCIPFPFWVSEERMWWNCDICAGVSTQIYNKSHTTHYDYLEMNCPQGFVQKIDISFLNLDTILEVEDELLDLCRAECTLDRMSNQTLV